MWIDAILSGSRFYESIIWLDKTTLWVMKVDTFAIAAVSGSGNASTEENERKTLLHSL